MKKILILIGLFLAISVKSQITPAIVKSYFCTGCYPTQSQFSTLVDYCYNDATTLVEADTGLLLATKTDLATKGAIPVNGLLYWNSVLNAYMPYPTGGAKGTFYRGATEPNSFDSTIRYQGNFNATTFKTLKTTDNSGINIGNNTFLSYADNPLIATYINPAKIYFNKYNGTTGTIIDTALLSTVGKITQGGVAADSGINGTSMKLTGQVAMTGLESNEGEYYLTQNPSTGEIYARELTHAFFGFSDSSRALSMASNATWYHVTNSGKTLWGDFESVQLSISNDTITIPQEGHYEIHYHIVFTGTNGVWFKMRLYNITQDETIPIPTATTAMGTNIVSIGNTAYCTNCQAGDKVVLQMIPESNGQTVTLIDGSMLIKMTHAE